MPTSWDDVLVNGTSLSSFGAVENFSDVLKCAPLRGSNLVIPGVAGSTFLPKVRGSFAVTVRLALWHTNDDFSGVMTKLRSLRLLVAASDSALTLTRRFTLSGGTQVEQDAVADFSDMISPELIGTSTARVALDFEVLSGWEHYGP